MITIKDLMDHAIAYRSTNGASPGLVILPAESFEAIFCESRERSNCTTTMPTPEKMSHTLLGGLSTVSFMEPTLGILIVLEVRSCKSTLQGRGNY